MWVRSLGQEDSPGGGNGNPLQDFAWEVSWTEEPGGLQSLRSHRVRQYFSLVQSLSCVQLFATPWTAHASLPVHHVGSD